ncbi:uncharacterized protein LOC115096840 [Rhinatrema bivittatum]|uniref:uncharacterized protein LOC115096840 n=1 Tax=Rhinatrema bivittatum TaxID=194408 RepID=UPI00112B008D|nr:uncharacterized protein LOC115096840 [Rhinatrema bivittatum]
MVISKGLGALEMYVGAEEGVAFRTDNDMYWSSCCDAYHFAVLARDHKDHSSKFQLTLLPTGKVLLRDFRDMYLGYVLHDDGVGRIEAEKISPDRFCEFEPFYEGEKVALRAINGMFVCRVFRRIHFIEASKPTAEECCRFRLLLGDLLYPGHDILQVELGDTTHIKCQSSVVKKETFVNKTEKPLSHTFNLGWEVRATDITTWARPWGLEYTTSATFTLLGMEATITYNGSHLKTASAYRNISEKRSATVIVPPHSRALAQLVVTKQDQVEVSFTADIKKIKQDGETVMMEERGSWKGLIYTNVVLDTKEEPVMDLDYLCTAL